MFTVGETRPNCDANEPQEDAQGTRQIRQGRLNNESPEQRERRLHSASSEEEGDIRKPQSKDNITWLSKDSAVRRKQPIPSLQINCAPSPSFARFCESRISSNYD